MLSLLRAWVQSLAGELRSHSHYEKKEGERERDEGREEGEVEKGVDMGKISRNFPVIN